LGGEPVVVFALIVDQQENIKQLRARLNTLAIVLDELRADRPQLTRFLQTVFY
jgi:hypothetical protein